MMTGRLLLRRFCGGRRANTNADLHRGVFGEDDVAAARNEVYVDRSARAERAHCDAKRLRTCRNSHRDAHEFESIGATSGLVQNIGVAIPGGRKGGQAKRNTRLQIPRFGGRGLRAALGIESEISGFPGLNPREDSAHLLVEAARQNELMKDEPKL